METKIEENLIEDAQNPEKKEEGFLVEMSTMKKIDSLVSSLNVLDKEVKSDSALSEMDLEKINSSLKGMGINIDGIEMTIEEASQIPDLKMNVELWKKIKSGEIKTGEDLTFIGVETIELLMKYAKEEGEKRQRLILGIRYISDQVSAELSKFNGIITFNGLEQLSDISAEFLSKYHGTYQSNGSMIGFRKLTGLSDLAVKHFVDNYKGDLLFEGPIAFSDNAMELWSHFEGSLRFWGLNTLSDKAVEYLAKRKCKLELNGDLIISDTSAKMLVESGNLTVTEFKGGPFKEQVAKFKKKSIWKRK